jgi:hypothetical protein
VAWPKVKTNKNSAPNHAGLPDLVRSSDFRMICAFRINGACIWGLATTPLVVGNSEREIGEQREADGKPTGTQEMPDEMRLLIRNAQIIRSAESHKI